VTIVKVGGHMFDVATFRKDGQYLDARRPETVEFGSRIDDVRRRDFTMNALYLDPLTGDIFDPEGGVADIRAKQVRCVGSAKARFKEDALRLLRAVRFAARFDFKIEAETLEAIQVLAPTVQYVSGERVRDELTSMITADVPSRAILMLDECGLLEWILPEVCALKGVEQGALHHPEGDVWVHTLLALDMHEPKSSPLAWAVLLHDIAKPPTFRRWEDGGISFHEHEKIGAEMAGAILNRLRFSREDIEMVQTSISRHMMFLSVTKMRRSTLRRFIGSPTIELDLALHRADCMGSTRRLDYYEFVKRALAEFVERNEHPVTKPLITGDDLIKLGDQAFAGAGRRAARGARRRTRRARVTTREDALALAQRADR
jgi:putative nucleotidyltransferase with HDIG domain